MTGVSACDVCVWQMNEMEALRIDEELRKQKVPQNPVNVNRYSKDSGVVDIELLKLSSDGSGTHRLSAPECERLKKTTLSNSLIDISEGQKLLCFSSSNGDICWRIEDLPVPAISTYLISHARPLPHSQ